jgi:CCR4-NOT transcription complex subunit 1
VLDLVRAVDVALDPENLVKAINELEPGLRWAEVIRSWGEKAAPPNDERSQRFVARLISATMPPQTTSAFEGLWRIWPDPLRQLALLEHLVFLPKDDLHLTDPARPVVSPDHAVAASTSVKALASGVQGSIWNELSLVETLIGLASSAELVPRVKDILEKAVQTCPDLVLIALVMIEVCLALPRRRVPAKPYYPLQKPWNSLHKELCARLVSLFLAAGHPSHHLVFYRLWQLDPHSVTAALGESYAESELNAVRVLDIAQELKILDHVLAQGPVSLSLDVAALASRRDLIDLEAWLGEQFSEHKGTFVKHALDFVSYKVRYDLDRLDRDAHDEPSTLSLGAQTVATFMRALRAKSVIFIAPETLWR